jgi:hypothetical protein
MPQFSSFRENKAGHAMAEKYELLARIAWFSIFHHLGAINFSRSG